MRNLFRLIYSVLTKSEKKELFLLFLGSIAMGLFEMVGVVSVVPFMMVASDASLVTTNQYLSFMYLSLGAGPVNQFLVTFGFILIALLVASNSFNAFIVWRITKFSHMQGHRVSQRLLFKQLSKRYVYFLERNVSDIVKSILTEVDRTVVGVLLPLLGMGSKIVTVFAILVMLLIFNPFLTIIALLIVSITYIVLYFGIRKKLLHLGELSADLQSKRYRVVYESLSGIKDVIMKNLSNEMIDRYSKPSQHYANVSAVGNALSEIPRFALELVIFGGIVGLVIQLLIFEDDSLFIATLSLFAMAGIRIMPAAQLIFRAFSTIRYNLPVLENLVRDFQDETNDDAQHQEKMSKIIINHSLQLNNVDFSYFGSNQKVLNNFCMEIKANTIVGIVGTSGSGKTTLINILLGLIKPDGGEILLDGVNLAGNNIRSWRNGIGYVPQDVFVFDASLFKNVALSVEHSEANLPRLKEVVSLAELDDFVHSMNGGYNGELGERGSKMSGGQRQRLGIARALYSNPSILVFDEATSALDGITEGKIMDSISKLKKDHTIIMVAHRTTTLKTCDTIYLLEGGEIKDSGDYNYLMKNNTTFRKMAEQKSSTVENSKENDNTI